jgi:alpha-glucosidase
MDNFKDFTVDPKRFVDIKAFITEIKEKGIRFVPIVDAGIASRPDEEYLPYSAGLAYRAFITTENDEPLVGNVWPVEVVFPDFFATIT